MFMLHSLKKKNTFVASVFPHKHKKDTAAWTESNQ